MADVDVDGVLAIIDTEVDEDVIEEVYIPMARRFMDANLLGVLMSDSADTEIHRFLTAHFIAATRDIEAGALIEYKADSITTRVGGALGGKVFGPGLKMTRFGQSAIEFDTSGTLAGLAEGKPLAEFEVIELPDPNATI